MDPIAVAADGLIVVERALADHQLLLPRNGAATPDGPTGAQAGEAGALLSLPPMAWLWRNVLPVTLRVPPVHDTAAIARDQPGIALPLIVAVAAPGHVASELTVV